MQTSWRGEIPRTGCPTCMLMTGLGDDEVCIDYRICLMGHNSLWGKTVSRATLAIPCPHAHIKSNLCGCLCSNNVNGVSRITANFPKTSSCHKNRKGWLGGLVVFGVFLFMGNKLFLNCFRRPAAESVPLSQLHMNPATRGWSQFSPAYWLILQRLCWKTAFNAIGTVGSQAIVLHACASIWFMNSTCVSYWIWSD